MPEAPACPHRLRRCAGRQAPLRCPRDSADGREGNQEQQRRSEGGCCGAAVHCPHWHDAAAEHAHWDVVGQAGLQRGAPCRQPCYFCKAVACVRVGCSLRACSVTFRPPGGDVMAAPEYKSYQTPAGK